MNIARTKIFIKFKILLLPCNYLITPPQKPQYLYVYYMPPELFRFKRPVYTVVEVQAYLKLSLYKFAYFRQ